MSEQYVVKRKSDVFSISLAKAPTYIECQMKAIVEIGK